MEISRLPSLKVDGNMTEKGIVFGQAEFSLLEAL
jgi:hypothetical protein